QRRAVAERSGAEGDRERAGDSEAWIDHAAHEVQGRGIRADKGRRREAHAVFQRVSAAVLLSDNGRDGSGDVERRSGDGDAGRQLAVDDRVDRADRDGEGIEVRDTRRRANGGRGHGVRSYRVGAFGRLPIVKSAIDEELCQETTLRFSAPSARTGITSRQRTRRRRRIASSSKSSAESAGAILLTKRRNDSGFAIADFGFWIEKQRQSKNRQSKIQNRLRGIVLAASTAVSKTVRPGSNPGTPAI